MGAFGSRQNAGVEEVDISVNHAYRYPPKSGNYFSSHFIMGGERFDTAQPEMYLFGENSDLNFLGSRPAPFPYPAPSASEPSRTLKALVNIRKESLRFVRVPDDSLSLKEPETRSASTHFNIEFTFDCDVRCAITIMYFCTEEVTSTGLIYTPRDLSMNSETYHYKRGANQQFSQVCHVFDPSQYAEESLLYSFDREVMPIVIYCLAEEGDEPYQSHATIAIVEKHSDGYTLKPLKQKLFVDGLCYLLQEIYGIENKISDTKVSSDDDPDDNGAECVICMCDLRDTLILPCRHLCLCNCCADSLRYQANNCPICRAPFRALLQIKALQKSAALASGGTPANNEVVKVARAPVMEGGGRGWSLAQQTHVYTESNGENIPPGYEAVSLIEALNGPSVAPQQPAAPPFQDMYVQLPQNAVDGVLDSPVDDSDNARGFQDNYLLKKSTPSTGLEDSTTQTDRPSSVGDSSEIIAKGGGTQMRMSVLMARESDESIASKTDEAVSPTTTVPSTGPISHKRRKSKYLKEDTVVCINETLKQKENSEGAISRKLRKSSASSLVTPQSPKGSLGIKETSLCSNERDDIENMTETLSLLDSVKVDKEEDKVISSSLSEIKPSCSSSSLPPDVGMSEILRAPQAEGECDDEDDDVIVVEQNEEAVKVKKPKTQSQSLDAELGQEEKPTGSPHDRAGSKNGHGGSSKGKAKQKSNRSSHKSRSSSGYGSTHYSEPSCTDESSPSLVPESHSLPGTPLSNSSAISRSSDASMSSASSTRALIIANPSHASSSAV